MKISDLVNKVEPFRFEFDGEVLEGTYYKYKTTTPNYEKALWANFPPLLEEGTDEDKAANAKARDEASINIGVKVLSDVVITWNAEDDSGEPVRPSLELFKQLPAPFTNALLEFFKKLRSGENPTSPDSPST